MDDLSKYEPQPLVSPILSDDDDDEAGVVLLLSSTSIGANKKKHLGKRLMHHFLFSLTEIPPRIRSIILVNEAVTLACKGSNVLEPLQVLNEAKINIIICQKSIRCYGGSCELAVGTTASMYMIVNLLVSADKVISM